MVTPVLQFSADSALLPLIHPSPLRHPHDRDHHVPITVMVSRVRCSLLHTLRLVLKFFHDGLLRPIHIVWQCYCLLLLWKKGRSFINNNGLIKAPFTSSASTTETLSRLPLIILLTESNCCTCCFTSSR